MWCKTDQIKYIFLFPNLVSKWLTKKKWLFYYQSVQFNIQFFFFQKLFKLSPFQI